MAKYIIEYTTTINGGKIKTYHEKISINDNLSANNIYVEHITPDIKKAIIFYDKDEAEKISNVFSNKYNIPTIKSIK